MFQGSVHLSKAITKKEIQKSVGLTLRRLTAINFRDWGRQYKLTSNSIFISHIVVLFQYSDSYDKLTGCECEVF